MYKIYLKDQGEKYPLYEPLDDELRVFSPVLTQEMGKAGYFEFHMMVDHPYADRLGLLRTEVVVYDDGREIFHGRVLKPEYNIQNLISVTCEGDFTYLLDSQQRPFELESDIPGFIEKLLEVHNGQVDDFKKMLPGRITVTDKAGYAVRQNKKFVATLSLLKTQMSDVYGGYFRVRNKDGKKYLDYLLDYGGENEQAVRFGENLLELNKYMDAASIITCLIPLGAEVEYKDEAGEKQIRTIDITSVNGGVDYLQNDAGVKQYGKVWGTYQWDEVTKPEDLLEKAKKYLQEASALPVAMEVNAIDLSLIDDSVQRFELGYWTQIISVPHGIDRKLLLTKRVINLLDPTQGGITLGKPEESFVDQAVKAQQNASKAVDKVAGSASAEINRMVENATKLITGGLGGYVVLDVIDPETGKQIHPWRMLIMDAPEKDAARSVVQINKNGIGFSTTGINGPYTTAWTIDGSFVADFITAGQMLADRIRGGILEVGGQGLSRDGKIVVKDIVDKQIGYWDKTGLHVMLGVIEGSQIIGSDIISGTIDIGNGTFEVDRDGSVIMNSGEIHIGNTWITPNYTWLGDYGISSGDVGLFYSRDSGNTIQIASKPQSWLVPGLTVQYGKKKTSYMASGISTSGDIYFDDPWTEGMTALDMFKDLYRKIRELKS